MTTKSKAPAAETPVAEAPNVSDVVISGTKVLTNIEVVDNTFAEALPERDVETEQYEVLNGITQVNYL